MKYAMILLAAGLAVAGCGTTTGGKTGTCVGGGGKCAAACSGTCKTGPCVGTCKDKAAPAATCSGTCAAATTCCGKCNKAGAAAAAVPVAAATRGLATAVYVDQPPALDGTLSSPLWQKGAALELGKVSSTEKGSLQTKAYLLFDKQNLYLGWESLEKETDKLVADATDRDGQVWSDDNLEFFVSPDGDKAYHFVVNSKGVLYDGRGDVNEADDATWNSGAVAKAVVEKGKGWTGTLAIPLKDLNVKSGKGQSWMLNLNRTKPVKDSDGGVVYTESSWSATGKSRYSDATGWGKLAGVNVP
jgi:hypothetical protein